MLLQHGAGSLCCAAAVVPVLTQALLALALPSCASYCSKALLLSLLLLVLLVEQEAAAQPR
jgi:hypothetical protein